jgi:hypothetical protein
MEVVSENLEVRSEVTTLVSRGKHMTREADIQERVQISSPNGLCCLITGGTLSVDLCHCIPRVYMYEEKAEEVCHGFSQSMCIYSGFKHLSSIASNGTGT